MQILLSKKASNHLKTLSRHSRIKILRKIKRFQKNPSLLKKLSYSTQHSNDIYFAKLDLQTRMFYTTESDEHDNEKLIILDIVDRKTMIREAVEV